MKKIFGIAGSLIIVLLTAQVVFAHPPAKIDITYDAATKTVNAVIVHPVQDPQTHYINKVDVSVNGNEVIEQKISMQENANEETVSYRISDVNPGDVVDVEGYCNINGKLEKTVEIK